MKILIADGSDDFRKQLYERLREVPGATVVSQAAHEDQAVIAAALSCPDVVLTDLELASGCGFSMMERLRAGGFAGIAYLVTSADEAEYGPQCPDAGLDGFYDKGHDLDRLVRALAVLATAPVAFGQKRIHATRMPAGRTAEKDSRQAQTA